MQIKKHIPNILTLLNLLSGCLAVVSVAEHQFQMAFFWVCLGIFFDFFDGFFARLFKVSGPLGLQLDSLADMVTSGVAPGFVLYSMFEMTQGCDYMAYAGFIITLGACFRLANFNIDTRQTDSFIGLPTPANALFFMSLPLIPKTLLVIELFSNPWFLLVLSVLSAYVMNAELPLFSLKVKNFSFAKYKLQIFFLALSVLMLILLHVSALPLIIVTYVLLSVVDNKFKITHKA